MSDLTTLATTDHDRDDEMARRPDPLWDWTDDLYFDESWPQDATSTDDPHYYG